MVRAAHIVVVVKARDVLGIRRRSGTSAILIIRTVNRRRIDVGGQASVAARAAVRDARRSGYSIRDVLDPLLVSYKFSPVARRVDGCSLGKIQIEGEVNAFLVLHMFASNLLLGADHGWLGGCGRRPVIIHCIHAVMRRMPIIRWALINKKPQIVESETVDVPFASLTIPIDKNSPRHSTVGLLKRQCKRLPGQLTCKRSMLGGVAIR